MARARKASPSPVTVDDLVAHVRELQLATLTDCIAAPSAYTYEFKFDGYRMMAAKVGADVRLISRNRQDWTATFGEVVKAVAALGAEDAIVDGEVCIVDERGVPRFQRLQRRGHAPANVVFFAFDLLWHQGEDLRSLPIEERRGRLARLVGAKGRKGLALSSAVEGDPRTLLELARSNGLEGIVAKRKGSIYVGGRSSTWLKWKCTRRQEFAVVGYRMQGGTRSVGALLLAVCSRGEFVYVGRVGTGFDETTRRELAKFLDAHPSAEPVARGAPSFGQTARWSLPLLVVEVEFLEWTSDGQIRHPSFRGVRIDRNPEDCAREVPLPVVSVDGAKKTRTPFRSSRK
jgi:bifunctional non-homologous end joining protein LigD